MKAIIADGNGGISIVERQKPLPKPNEELIKVAAFGINRADLLQIAGRYPPPPGSTDILGLEASGYLENGDLVGTLLTAGGYAEYVTVPKSTVLRFSKEISTQLGSTHLAAIPEAFLAAYHTLFQRGELSANETVYINAAGSGVGTCAIQLAALIPNVTIIACAGSDRKLDICRSLGAHHVINYKDEGIFDKINSVTNGAGVHLAIDCVGAAQFIDIQRALVKDGRWVMYGLLSGAKSPDISLTGVVMKRLSILGTTMRSRSEEYRAEIVSSFMKRFGQHFGVNGALRAIVDKQFDGLDKTAQALDYMRSNQNIGKIIVKVE